MQSSIHIKVRYSEGQGRYLSYFYITEASGRTYGSNVFYSSHDVKIAMRAAVEEGARRRIPVIPFVW